MAEGFAEKMKMNRHCYIVRVTGSVLVLSVLLMHGAARAAALTE